jgi:two-component system, LytTR family, sensor kinase
MLNQIDKKLIRAVIITTPIISVLVVTPIYLIAQNLHINYFSACGAVMVGVLFFWLTQIIIKKIVEERNLHKNIYLFSLLAIILSIGLIQKSYFTDDNYLENFTNTKIFFLRTASLVSANWIIYILVNFIYSQENELNLNKENSELKFNILESEYKLLKEQINPHFIFNALSISKSLIKNQPAQAERYIVQLSDFLRASFNNEQNVNTLEKELIMCNSYIELQKVRFGELIQIHINCSPKKYNFNLPFFTIITLLENAIKHNGFSEDEPLIIQITTLDNYLEVKNMLKPINEMVSTKTGLNNLNLRSKLLSGEEIQIIKSETEFAVKVKLIAE